MSRVVTKPATSRLTTTQVLPTRSANSRAIASVWSLVCSPRTSSQSVHQRHRGEEVRAHHLFRTPRRTSASCVIGNADVLVASTASGAEYGVERPEDVLLDLEPFEDRLDGDDGVGEVDCSDVVGVMRASTSSGLLSSRLPWQPDAPPTARLPLIASLERAITDVVQAHLGSRPARRPGRCRLPSVRLRRRRRRLPSLLLSFALDWQPCVRQP